MINKNNMKNQTTVNENIVQKYFEDIELILQRYLIKSGGIQVALIIDRAGNIIAKNSNENAAYDLYSLAALASANIAAVGTMAQIIGEEAFSILFHKGKQESIHFNKLNDEYWLITIFSKDISLGPLRLKLEKALKKIKDFWEDTDLIR